LTSLASFYITSAGDVVKDGYTTKSSPVALFRPPLKHWNLCDGLAISHPVA